MRYVPIVSARGHGVKLSSRLGCPLDVFYCSTPNVCCQVIFSGLCISVRLIDVAPYGYTIPVGCTVYPPFTRAARCAGYLTCYAGTRRKDRDARGKHCPYAPQPGVCPLDSAYDTTSNAFCQPYFSFFQKFFEM